MTLSSASRVESRTATDFDWRRWVDGLLFSDLTTDGCILALPRGREMKCSLHMLASQIFQTIPTALAATLFTYLRKEERESYKGVVERLAEQQKMRPVFITKQSPEKQVKLLTAACSRKPAEPIAMQVLEIWLMRGRQEMLVDFLDRMKIAHDGAGMVEKFPEVMDPALLGSALAAMRQTYPAGEVALYLYVLQEQKEGGWPELSALLEAEPWLGAV
ncbi:MAG: hypothetical protein ACI8Z5_001408 [Lentimonas sp.]|jgi:hypothetical protein